MTWVVDRFGKSNTASKIKGSIATESNEMTSVILGGQTYHVPRIASER